MSWIRSKLESFAERIAGHESGETWTYRDFLNSMERSSAELPTGTQKIIEVSCEKTMKGLARLLAVHDKGHIAFPLISELPPSECDRMRKQVAQSELYKKLRNSGLILFSSGTSDKPKGMLHDFEVLIDRYKNIRSRDDCCLLLLLIDHIGGLDTAFRCLFAGSTLVIPEHRTPDAASVAIETNKVNVLPTTPTFLNLMLLSEVHKKYNLSSLKIIAYGAEPMPYKLLMRLMNSFPQVKLQQKFGTSETGAIKIKSINNESLYFYIDDSDTEWKIIKDELWLKTPSRILGYLNNEEELNADGWYATGDLVVCDHKNNLRIVGRASEIINVGGQKVHPTEVEAVVSEISGIDGVRVYGKENPLTGKTIVCEIISKEKKDLRTWKRKIRQHCQKKLPPWKIPTSVIEIDSLRITKRMKREHIIDL